MHKELKARYTLGSFNFSTWDEVVTHTRKILAKGCRQLNQTEFGFVMDLLTYHPHYELKIMDGVNSIRVGSPEYGSHFCFIILDDKGKETDFSHKKCRPITKKDKSKALETDKRNAILTAYRQAITTDIMDYWDANEKICCCCSVKFDIQVDHVIPFVKLVSDFENSHDFDKYPKLERHNDSLHTFRFSITRRCDSLFVQTWQNYHRDNCKLQMLCKTCNLKKGSGSVRYSGRLLSDRI